LSVENGHNQKPKLNSNSTSNLNEFRSPASSTFSSPSSKVDTSGKLNKNGTSNAHSSINFENSEEFGLSVTKIDNNTHSQDANKSTNGTPNKNNTSSNGIAKKRVRIFLGVYPVFVYSFK